MMKIYLYLIIILLSFVNCKSQNDEEQSFEGKITYKTELVFPNDIPYKDYIKQKYGNTIVIYYSKGGDILYKYPNSGNMGFDFSLYRNENNKTYAKWRNIDTIYNYSASENSLKLTHKKLGKSKTILNQDCKFIKYEAIDTIGNQNIYLTYHYGGYPYLDSALFKNNNNFFLSDTYSESKSPLLKVEMNLGDFILNYTAIKIEKKELKSKLFTLPKGIPFKEF